MLFAAEPSAAHEPEDQPSPMDRVKVWARKGADITGPILKKAASLTLSGAKKAGAAGIAFSKATASRIRDEIAKRRGEKSTPDSSGVDAAVDEQAATAQEDEATEK